jgi:hypothetical protein
MHLVLQELCTETPLEEDDNTNRKLDKTLRREQIKQTYKEENQYDYHSRHNKYPSSHDSTLIHNLLSPPPFLLGIEMCLNSVIMAPTQS